jgi:hypothetical protein
MMELMVCTTERLSHQIVMGGRGAVKELAHEVEKSGKRESQPYDSAW